jgi:hypothetical protein
MGDQSPSWLLGDQLAGVGKVNDLDRKHHRFSLVKK